MHCLLTDMLLSVYRNVDTLYTNRNWASNASLWSDAIALPLIEAMVSFGGFMLCYGRFKRQGDLVCMLVSDNGETAGSVCH